mmetsp:Transcript_6327/g.15252  ORF Transcript_6327/g.15252 Transcript_6327/m.15252 type:complete len:111 (-) Transcript_6327:110-442(-)
MDERERHGVPDGCVQVGDASVELDGDQLPARGVTNCSEDRQIDHIESWQNVIPEELCWQRQRQGDSQRRGGPRDNRKLIDNTQRVTWSGTQAFGITRTLSKGATRPVGAH